MTEKAHHVFDCWHCGKSPVSLIVLRHNGSFLQLVLGVLFAGSLFLSIFKLIILICLCKPLIGNVWELRTSSIWFEPSLSFALHINASHSVVGALQNSDVWHYQECVMPVFQFKGWPCQPHEFLPNAFSFSTEAYCWSDEYTKHNIKPGCIWENSTTIIH